MLKSVALLNLFVLLPAVVSGAVITLERHAIEAGSLTVSGISAGACMATQFHVAFSRDVNGMGSFAGVPYGCAKGMLGTALNCMSSPFLTSVPSLITRTDKHEADGLIDSTTEMANDKIYVFAGTQDSTVAPKNGEQMVTYYEHYVKSSNNFKTSFDIAAEHCQPTHNFGGLCNRQNSANWINNCNYMGAYEMLNHLYGGNLQKGLTAVASNLFLFDQGEFFGGRPGQFSMDSEGYVYIPTECQDPTRLCKLHVAFHGCLQSRQEVGDVYAVNAGYLEVAEANDIIVLFPQAVKTTLSNPNGCFDWWGYHDNNYETKSGGQMSAIYAMLKRLGL